jgi:phosphoribosylanthranilate isomerase
MRLKICGITRKDNLDALSALNPDYMGFIFYPGSPRYMANTLSPEDLQQIPGHIIKTGVFVNAGIIDIMRTIDRYQLDAVQLHGNETPEFCGLLHQRTIVIKSIGVDEHFSPTQLQPYESVCNYFLFDTATIAHGGSGRRFDTALLQTEQIRKPFFLSGGIDQSVLDSEFLAQATLLHALDINSRFETAPGIKNIEQVKRFTQQLETQQLLQL